MARNLGKLDIQEGSLLGLRASLLAGSAFRWRVVLRCCVTGLQAAGGEAAGALLTFW